MTRRARRYNPLTELRGRKYRPTHRYVSFIERVRAFSTGIAR